MSGIDEQFQDMPKCSECGKEPDYWILKTSFSSGRDVDSVRPVIAWLFSEDYALTAKEYYQGKRVGIGDKYHNVEITEFTADDITLAETTCCRKIYHGGPIFNEVKKAVSYYLEREGFGSERRR